MKTPPSSRFTGAALTGALACLVFAEAFAAEPAPSPEKTHVLFMGADISVVRNKKPYLVEDVDGSEFVIKVGGKNTFVPTRMRNNNLQVGRELKLSTASAKLDDLQGGPGYTPANDPNLKFIARSGAAGGAAAARDLATYQRMGWEAALAGAQAGGDRAAIARAQDGIDAASRAEQVAGSNLSSDYGSAGAHANLRALELAEENYDMVDISFKVSSPVPLDDPYMIVLVEFLPRGAKENETSLLIHAKALDPIGAKPKYIRVREGGMPIGFKFKRYEVHLYNRGKEIATNASPNRVELTREEARQYLLIEYLSANKLATVPPAPMPGSLPADLRGRLSPAQLERTFFVRVSKDGTLIGAYVDEACSVPLPDEQTTAVLKDAFFKPALANGKPMDGVAQIRLGSLLL